MKSGHGFYPTLSVPTPVRTWFSFDIGMGAGPHYSVVKQGEQPFAPLNDA